MLNFNEIITITFTLFAVIDIVGAIPLLISMRNKIGEINAELATVVSGLLMTVFFLIGEKFLSILGVDIHSFALAGSIVLFIIGMEMILGREFFKSDLNPKTGSIVPIAFPIIAGSGTLTTIMALKADYAAINIYVSIVINLLIIYLVLKTTRKIEKILGQGGLYVIRKFFGIILIAIAVKIFKNSLVAL